MSTATPSTAPPQENGAPARRRKDPPERKIGPFANGVGVCIWSNQTTNEHGTRTFRTITINPRRYFDRESNQWKDAPSFNPSDLPSLIYALQLASKILFEEEAPEHDGAEAAPGNGEEIPF